MEKPARSLRTIATDKGTSGGRQEPDMCGACGLPSAKCQCPGGQPDAPEGTSTLPRGTPPFKITRGRE